MIEYKINDCNYNIKNFIKEIITKEFNIDFWNEWLDSQDYDKLKIKPNILVSAEESNELLGICSIKELSKKECYLNSFYVKKEFRNRGIGTNLYNICMDYAQNNNYQKVILVADGRFKDAIRMYEKNDFIFDYLNKKNNEVWYHKDI